MRLMDFRDMLQLFNILLAILAIPPSLLLLFTVTREKRVITPEQAKTNDSLVIIFGGTALFALINALISVTSVLFSGRLAHDVSPFRTLGINIFFSTISWFIYFSHIGIRRKK